MMKNFKNKKKKGFTLIELIIVIAIIAILAAIAVPQFGKIRKKAAINTDVSNAKTIQGAVTALVADEEILLPTSGKFKVMVLSRTDVGGTDADDKKVISYLQSVPVTKNIQKGEFVVTLDDKGIVKIYIQKTGQGALTDSGSTDVDTVVETGLTLVYPNGTEDYNIATGTN